MEKDIPFLQKILPTKFTAAYMKGRANYACLYRIHKADDQPILSGLDEMDVFSEVRDWSYESETGDRAELRDLPEDIGFWSRINAMAHVHETLYRSHRSSFPNHPGKREHDTENRS